MIATEYKQQIFAKNPQWSTFEEDVKSFKRISVESYSALQRSKKNYNDEEIQRAFQSLEEYALNLVRFPWKDEIKTLRSYSGYFQMNVARVLDEPSILLAKLGYHNDQGIYKITDVKTREDLLLSAADFRATYILVDDDGTQALDITDDSEDDDLLMKSPIECHEKLIVDLPFPPPHIRDTGYGDVEMREPSGDNISISSDVTRGHDDIPTEKINKLPPRKPANDSMENMEAFYQNVDEVDRNLNQHLRGNYHYPRDAQMSSSHPHMAAFRSPCNRHYTTDAMVHEEYNASDHTMVRGESLNCMTSSTSTVMQPSPISRSESMDGLPKAWPCPRCTYSNKPSNDVCEVCESGRFCGKE